jgi:hypothetical protein
MSLDPDLLVIVPSRGRPAAVAGLAASFLLTCTADTGLVFAVDDNDPLGDAYAEAIADVPYEEASLWINRGEKTMVAALNGAVTAMLTDTTKAVAFMGDDHRPRTVGWDHAYLDALQRMGTGIVYGDDLLQHARIPTQVAMTANIVRTLGHMAPASLTHLFVDNYWRDLGAHAGCLHYLPDVVVEHMHPFAGKADWDAGHIRVNDHVMYRADSVAYGLYAADGKLAADVAKVKALR